MIYGNRLDAQLTQKEAAENDLRGMAKAIEVYSHDTVPVLKEIQELLKSARDKVSANVMTQETMLDSAQSTRAWVGLFGLIGLIVCVLLGVIITRMIVRPLNRIMQGTEALARGDMEVMIKVDTQDEFGKLAKSFNLMTDNLKESMVDSQEKLDYLNNIPTPVMAVDREFTGSCT